MLEVKMCDVSPDPRSVTSQSSVADILMGEKLKPVKAAELRPPIVLPASSLGLQVTTASQQQSTVHHGLILR